MMASLLGKIFGTRNDRELKRMRKVVVKVNEFTEATAALSDEQLREKTTEFKRRVTDGETLDAILPEAFAVCREASERALGLRHFDVQLIGGLTLHEGKIAEMRTGEGKTLVATLPSYLNALSGSPVHLVTVNDYLARRDAGWMGPLHEFLGLKVGFVVSGQSREEKAAAYDCDIVYGTNNEFGFDYLRDNMAVALEDKMQRDTAFAIVDEVDSILIDEARTPLIISGPTEDHSAVYKQVNLFIPQLKRAADVEDGEEKEEEEEEGHYTIDEKSRHLELNEVGHQLVESLLSKSGMLKEGDSLYSPANLNLLHHVLTGLRAHVMFFRDVDYIVQEKQVVLIDEHTGRTMPGRRLSEGLHQAIEAKEGVAIQTESQTLASTTFQNFFRLYDKLSGMTGTADTEAEEFHEIYALDVVLIPTNVDVHRDDMNDLIFLTQDEKFDAIADDIKTCLEKGAPILVGTASIETSEELSGLLEKKGIEHKVLNAKFHAKEAEIIAQAGRPGAVTIATNMAGRGTDIVLGGNFEVEVAAMDNPSEDDIAVRKTAWEERHKQVLDAGGLHVLGTERHESRRIDNQLRGRSGRQGDPGVSRFYLSLEDNLMRIFASDKVKSFMQALGMEKGEAIEHRMVSNAIEKAQRKVEGRNFDIRKQLLEYDDVANDQRQIVYQQRNTLLELEDFSELLVGLRSDVVNEVISDYIPPGSVWEQWDVAGLEQQLESEFNCTLAVQEWLDADDDLHEEPLRERIVADVQAGYEQKAAMVGAEMSRFEKHIMLQVLDQLWKEHLSAMDHLRQGIHLRAYASKNPKQEYKRESYGLFESMLDNFYREVITFLSKVQIKLEDAEALEQQRREEEAKKQIELRHEQATALLEEKPNKPTASFAPTTREGRKVGRNEACPCGSGKKYKQCHGKL
ncbi:MAG: preprotein translocase subunit SecA [Pseudomonadales bacterium]